MLLATYCFCCSWNQLAWGCLACIDQNMAKRSQKTCHALTSHGLRKCLVSPAEIVKLIDFQSKKSNRRTKKYTSSPWKISSTKQKSNLLGIKLKFSVTHQLPQLKELHPPVFSCLRNFTTLGFFLRKKKSTKWYKFLAFFRPFFSLRTYLGFFLKPDFWCPSYFFSKISGLCRMVQVLALFVALLAFNSEALTSASKRSVLSGHVNCRSSCRRPTASRWVFVGLKPFIASFVGHWVFMVSSPEYTNIVTKQRQYPQCSAAGLIHTSGHHHLNETTFHQFPATALDQNHSNRKAPHHHRSGAASVTSGMKLRKRQEIHVQASIKMVVRSQNMGSRSHRSSGVTPIKWSDFSPTYDWWPLSASCSNLSELKEKTL